MSVPSCTSKVWHIWVFVVVVQWCEQTPKLYLQKGASYIHSALYMWTDLPVKAGAVLCDQFCNPGTPAWQHSQNLSLHCGSTVWWRIHLCPDDCTTKELKSTEEIISLLSMSTVGSNPSVDPPFEEVLRFYCKAKVQMCFKLNYIYLNEKNVFNGNCSY